jgi:hypothetical protein
MTNPVPSQNPPSLSRNNSAKQDRALSPWYIENNFDNGRIRSDECGLC